MPMQVLFYPNYEYHCPLISHCPHLGSAALGTVVNLANQNQLERDGMFRTIEAQREQISRQLAEIQRLEYELQQVKLELKLERQNKFATHQQQSAIGETPEPEPVASSDQADASEKKKRGAPVGHPGWFRPTPTEYDWAVEVPAPSCCPSCQGPVTIQAELDPLEHLQEDLVEGVYRVVLYRHVAACCDACGAAVQQAGEGEILGSRIGPQLRSSALFLRHVIGISYRKVPQAIQELFGITFTPAALIGFEKMLARLAEPVVEDIQKKLASTDGPVHADETYSTLNGARAYYWVHANDSYVHFHFDTTRSGEVSRKILGKDFTGTLVTDCYAGYAAHAAGAKQKCLSHLARTARDWQKLTDAGSPDFAFFEDIKQFVKRGCTFHRLRGAGTLGAEAQATEMMWPRDELTRLATRTVTHAKALTLQGRIIRHLTEWLVFVDDPRVPPTNNLAERALRPLVVLRKVTFGHRSLDGGQRMASLMSLAETARRHGHRASQIFRKLFTHPPNEVLCLLYTRE
jgi:transposase